MKYNFNYITPAFILALGLTLFSAMPCRAFEIKFTANEKVWTEKPDAKTGLNLIAVVSATPGCRITASGLKSGEHVKWQKFSNLGAAYAEDVEPSRISSSLDESSLEVYPGDMGYVVTAGTVSQYIWLTDYSQHATRLSSLNESAESDCASLILDFNGSGDAIYYYSINGRRFELDRNFKLNYYSQKYSEESNTYVQDEIEKIIPHLSSKITLDAPLAGTEITLSGDRFLDFWDRGQSISSPYIEAKAVEASSSAEQEDSSSDNQIDAGQTEGFGGNAPCHIVFKSACSEAAAFKQWEFSDTEDFENITLSFPQEELDYTFNEEGTIYVRFVAADNSGVCRYECPSYTVSIGSSMLKIPNAFSPGATPGINDEWKVSYRSLVKFECHIFNSRGLEMFSFRDPDAGWDGKYKGKLVPAGVYYYVITAQGADGKNYKKSGDINIVNLHGPSGSGDVEGGGDQPASR